MNKEKFEYLKKQFKPISPCMDAGFVCDFEVDESGKCVCQWAISDEKKRRLIAARGLANAFIDNLKGLGICLDDYEIKNLIIEKASDDDI